MLDFNPLFEFSRSNCIAICAFLVPANLLATSQTMVMVWRCRPLSEIGLMAIVSSLYATIMLLHVMTWFIIGVVQIPTFVLTGLAAVCLLTNSALAAWSFWGDNRRSGTVRSAVSSAEKLSAL